MIKLTLDSTPLEIDGIDTSSFQSICECVQGRLLEQKRAIAGCLIDGVEVQSQEDADAKLSSAKCCDFISVTVAVAVQSALALRCNALRQTEEDCNTFVTDILLDEPLQVFQNWQAFCEQLKDHIRFLPSMAALFSQDEIDHLIERHVVELNQIMEAASEAFKTADVVSVSDLLELRLLPWIKAMRELMQKQLEISAKLE